MNYRRLGRTGLKVSEISLGTWISCDDLSQKECAFRIIDKAFELGINFFDTANVYQNGRAEQILGEALEKYPRESVVVATKVFWPMGEGPNDRGLSRKHIIEQVDKSLLRLGMDYIDLYYCHWFDTEVPIDESLRAMDHLVEKGKVLYFGVSNWTAMQIAEGLGVVDRYLLNPIVVNQSSYNMFDRYIEQETIPLCARTGVGLVAYSPLGQGVLSGKYRKGKTMPKGSRAAQSTIQGAVTVLDYLNDDIRDHLESLHSIAADLRLSLSQLALAWTLRIPQMSSSLTGASSPAQVEENAKGSGVTIPGEVLAKIEGILKSCTYQVKHNIIRQ
jgi:aryl-alcohol dehydrogenase-like predicted oxidoreductase